MEKKKYMQPHIEMTKMETGHLLDNSVTGKGVTLDSATCDEEVDGDDVNSKSHTFDMWE